MQILQALHSSCQQNIQACKAQTAQVAGEDIVANFRTSTVKVILPSVSGARQMAPMFKAAMAPDHPWRSNAAARRAIVFL